MMHANSHATTLVKVLDTFYRFLVYPSLLYVSSILAYKSKARRYHTG